MRKRIIIFIDENILLDLEQSSMRKAKNTRSRAIEYYMLIGLAVDLKHQVALPITKKYVKDSLQQLQLNASQLEANRRKLNRKP